MELESILAHELAHIRRHDYVVNLLQVLAETLLFYHPAVWWISHELRREREHCCDDLVVGFTRDPVSYARALTNLEQLRSTLPSIALGANGGALLPRIQRLLNAPTKTSRHGIFPISMTILVLLALLLFRARNELRAEPQSSASPRLSSTVPQAAGSDLPKPKRRHPVRTRRYRRSNRTA